MMPVICSSSNVKIAHKITQDVVQSGAKNLSPCLKQSEDCCAAQWNLMAQSFQKVNRECCRLNE